MSSMSSLPGDEHDELALVLRAAALPAFRFGHLTYGFHRAHWVSRSEHATGLRRRTIVTTSAQPADEPAADEESSH